MTIIVYSYPRSGSCWVRYIVNELMGWDHTSYPSTMLGECKENYCAKIHLLNLKNHWNYINLEKDKLITIVRNYKECITRNNNTKKDYDIYKAILPQSRDRINPSYVHPILFHEDFTPNRKLLIYYEDLIQNPQLYIWQISELLNVNSAHFLDNLEYHQQISLNIHPTGNKNETQGKKELHYIYKLGREKSIEWDNMFKQRYPELYYTYLVRYEGYPDE